MQMIEGLETFQWTEEKYQTKGLCEKLAKNMNGLGWRWKYKVKDKKATIVFVNPEKDHKYVSAMSNVFIAMKESAEQEAHDVLTTGFFPMNKEVAEEYLQLNYMYIFTPLLNGLYYDFLARLVIGNIEVNALYLYRNSVKDENGLYVTPVCRQGKDGRWYDGDGKEIPSNSYIKRFEMLRGITSPEGD